jgi:uncharacterized protein YkwD
MSASRSSLLGVLAAVVLLAAPATAAKNRDGGTNAQRETQLDAATLVEVNALRARLHLAPLRLSRPLGRAALRHSLEMARAGFFAHESADGESCSRRIRSFYPSKGYRFWRVGETLLWASPDIDAAGAVKLWMASPAHRAILTTPRWREIGISAVHLAAGTGEFAGHEVTIITADFGFRAR